MNLDVRDGSRQADSALLESAELLLRNEGYAVETVDSFIRLLLAENHYFIVAIVATNTIRELIEAEASALSVLSERLGVTDLGAKKWDAYLVLLTQEKAAESDEITRDLYSINYDTTRIRRIAHAGVDATNEAVRQALAPFVDPQVEAHGEALTDALQALSAAIIARGVSKSIVDRAVGAFEQGVSLDDVL